MALTLYYHPLSSFCQKVLIALYENATPFAPHFVDLAGGDPPFAEVWPIRKFPVLREEVGDRWIAESSIIIEYLAQHAPGPVKLIPGDPDAALRARMHDRFLDLHVHLQVQKIVGEALRPAGKHDPQGIADARAMLRTAYGMLERDLAGKSWMAGADFTMADCAAAPALFYANEVAPFGTTHPNLAAYFSRLKARPSYARVLKEAEPYFHLFPKDKIA